MLVEFSINLANIAFITCNKNTPDYKGKRKIISGNTKQLSLNTLDEFKIIKLGINERSTEYEKFCIFAEIRIITCVASY